MWHYGLILTVIALIASSAWLFVELADEVIEEETHAFDTRILLAMRDKNDPSNPWGPAWFEELCRDMTALGGIGVLALITAACVGGMLISGRRRTACLILIAIFGGIFLSLILKSGFDRPRPDLVPHGSYVYSQSFPSGHATISTVTYLTLGFLMAGTYKSKIIRGYIIAVAAVDSRTRGVEQDLSRRPLAHRCAGRLGAGHRLGTALLADRILAQTKRKNRTTRLNRISSSCRPDSPVHAVNLYIIVCLNSPQTPAVN